MGSSTCLPVHMNHWYVATYENYCDSGLYNTQSYWSYLTRCGMVKVVQLTTVFYQIPLTTDKNLEAKICHDQDFGDESVLVKSIKLYIQ